MNPTNLRRRLADGFARCVGLLIDAGVFLLEVVPQWIGALARSRSLRRLARPLAVGARVMLLALLVSLALLGLGALCLERVPPGAVAVRQVTWGASAGIVPRDYTTGMVFALRARSRWHRLDGRTHVVHFAWASEGGTRPILEVRTREGNAASVAVSVPYRIRSGEAHAIVAEGAKALWRDRAEAKMGHLLSTELAELTSDEWADVDARQARAAAALARLREELRALHVEPEAVQLGTVFFPPMYEQALMKERLERQTLSTERSLARRASRRLANERVAQELSAEEDVARARWLRTIQEERLSLEALTAAERRATAGAVHALATEAEERYQSLVSDGSLALAEAQAEKERLAAQALATPGGRVRLAQRAASGLRFSRLSLDSSDPRVPTVFDLDGMVNLLMGSAEP